VYFTLSRTSSLLMPMSGTRSPWANYVEHLRNPALRVAFAIGFLILFVFLGVFTYVNFVLRRAPLEIAPMALGIVYFVFLPSMFTTPIAGKLVAKFGVRPSCFAGLAVAALGLPLLVVPNLPAVLAGMVLVAVGTFFAQATTTGFVGRAATTDRASANGIYLASYFLGGLVGAAVLGQVFDGLGWGAVVAGVGIALAVAALLATQLKIPEPRLQPAIA
jgi:predicted MFS family arabinose efflux permease